MEHCLDWTEQCLSQSFRNSKVMSKICFGELMLSVKSNRMVAQCIVGIFNFSSAPIHPNKLTCLTLHQRFILDMAMFAFLIVTVWLYCRPAGVFVIKCHIISCFTIWSPFYMTKDVLVGQVKKWRQSWYTVLFWNLRSLCFPAYTRKQTLKRSFECCGILRPDRLQAI